MRAGLVQQVQSDAPWRVEEPGGVAHDGLEHRSLVIAALTDNVQDLARRRLAF